MAVSDDGDWTSHVFRTEQREGLFMRNKELEKLAESTLSWTLSVPAVPNGAGTRLVQVLVNLGEAAVVPLNKDDQHGNKSAPHSHSCAHR